MELELNLPKRSWLSLSLMLALLGLLLVLGAIGRAVTPSAPRLLTWTEWQVFKGQREYRRECQAIRQHAARLAALLEGSPDPVRAQLLAEAIQAMKGQPALSYQRQSLLEAAQAARDWAVGALEKNDALLAYAKAQAALQALETDR